jgi:hypothetical protein
MTTTEWSGVTIDAIDVDSIRRHLAETFIQPYELRKASIS